MEEKLLEEWQERLGLQDWQIILKYNCSKEQMDDPEYSIGETNWETTNKCARICIISKEEYGTNKMLDFDFEKTLVHELLHCKFSMIDKDLNTYEGIVAEQARHQLINDLATALVMAKRGQVKRKLATNCKKVENMGEQEDKCNNCDTRNLLIDKIVEESKKQCEELESIERFSNI